MILHVDADAFFCQVERRRNPALAGCPALAVQQHQDVIAADAGAKKAGVTKPMLPADARALLRRVGGALVHVHTTVGQRVSYRPYLAASHELHGLLASAELARSIGRRIQRRRGGEGVHRRGLRAVTHRLGPPRRRRAMR